jgi:hypothetical protein
MPIVETPGQAIDFFLECALDLLVIETFVVRRKPRELSYLLADVGAQVPPLSKADFH